MPTVLATAVVGCSSTGDQYSEHERDLANSDLGRIPNAEVIISSDQPIGQFLAAIDVRIQLWMTLKASGKAKDDRRRESLEAEIQRFVSVRADELVFELESGPLRNRWIAAAGLGFARDEEVLGPLLAALGDSNRDVVGQALFGLGIRADADTPLDPLLEELRSAFEGYVRVNAAYAIYRVARAGGRDADVGPALRRALLDSEAPVRVQAARTLGVIVDSDAVDDLGGLLSDPVDMVFLSALDALSALAVGDISLEGPVARELVTALDEAPTTRREFLRREAAKLARNDYGGDMKYWRRWAFGLP
ncbi:HEAT repeat domain-containing protein [Engelhardtia mirabilis]